MLQKKKNVITEAQGQDVLGPVSSHPWLSINRAQVMLKTRTTVIYQGLKT